MENIEIFSQILEDKPVGQLMALKLKKRKLRVGDEK